MLPTLYLPEYKSFYMANAHDQGHLALYVYARHIYMFGHTLVVKIVVVVVAIVFTILQSQPQCD
jgi:hypothetical protein